MSVKTYSPGDTILTIDGNIITGFADGTFIVVEREVDAYAKVVGADGEVSRTKSANRSGSMTLTLKQSSNSNYTLGTLAAADEQSDASVVDIQCEDNLGNITFAGEGWIRKQPNQELSSDETSREWAFDMARIDFEYPAAS